MWDVQRHIQGRGGLCGRKLSGEWTHREADKPCGKQSSARGNSLYIMFNSIKLDYIELGYGRLRCAWLRCSGWEVQVRFD